MKKNIIALIALIIGGAGFVVSRKMELGFIMEMISFVVLFFGLLFMAISWVKANPSKDKKDDDDGPLL